MPKAKPSPRSSGNVNLSFNLINVPTTLYGGTVSDHGIKRNEYVHTPDGDHPVGRGQTDKVTGALLGPEAEIVKKIQTEYGPVYVEDHEIEAAFKLTPDTLVIKEFEPQGNIRHFVPKGLMFVEPRKNGSGAKKAYDPVASKILATLLRAMKKDGRMAVCELTTRGVPKPCVLMPDGKLWLIHHTDATREQRELPDVELVDAEVDMMSMLMQTMYSEEPLDFADERSEKIQALADEKAAAGEFDKPDETTVTAVPAASASVDLMALLAASVESAKSGQAA